MGISRIYLAALCLTTLRIHSNLVVSGIFRPLHSTLALPRRNNDLPTVRGAGLSVHFRIHPLSRLQLAPLILTELFDESKQCVVIVGRCEHCQITTKLAIKSTIF